MYNKLEVFRQMKETAARVMKQYQRSTDADFSVLIAVKDEYLVVCAPGNHTEESVAQVLNAIMERINQEQA